MPSASVGAVVSLGEAQAFVRVETGEEEAVLAGLIRTASALCESFLGQVVIAREFTEELPASSGWTRLRTSPLRAIASVEAVDAAGAATAIPSGSFAVDVDAGGEGWVRLLDEVVAGRIRVRGTAGLADEPNGVPEPIRQGVLRLVSHLFAARDGGDGGPPAAVTALWRPYRRLRFA